MTDQEHKFTSVLALPPELAKAIVTAQLASAPLRRDGSGDKGKYTTADAIAAEAGKALNGAGAAWVRLGVSFGEPTLANSDIGKQDYVGDVIQDWMIVHETGPAIRGCSRMPVIVSRGRPHDKAVGASLTYDVGAVLRGALCMERESKDGIDRRSDNDDGDPYQGRRERDTEPRCTGKLAPLAQSNIEKTAKLAALKSTDESTVLPAVVWDAACKRAQVKPGTDGGWPNAYQLRKSEGLRVRDTLAAWVSKAEPAKPDREPGDDGDEDDPAAQEAP